MNKKGFTTVELTVSFVMVVILLASLIGFTVTYRDKVKNEEIKSQLIDFKNTITKTVYDDIISLNYNSMSLCVGQDNCVVMTDENGNSHVLKIEKSCNPTKVDCSVSPCDLSECGVYVVYDETRYMLPDSDINTYYKENLTDDIRVLNPASDFSSFNFKEENSIYNLKMTYKHFMIDEEFEIMLTIN